MTPDVAGLIAVTARASRGELKRTGDNASFDRRAAQGHQSDGSLGAQPRAGRRAGAEGGSSKQTPRVGRALTGANGRCCNCVRRSGKADTTFADAASTALKRRKSRIRSSAACDKLTITISEGGSG